MAIKFPPPPYTGSGLLGALDNTERKTQHDLDDTKRMFSLCAELGIQKSSVMWYELALILARNLYPEKQKKGRKPKWTDTARGYLVVEIERLTGKGNEHPKTVKRAVYLLSKKEPWKSFVESQNANDTTADPGEALRQVYISFKNHRWAETCRKAFKWNELNGDIGSWEASVIEVIRDG